MPDRYRGLEAGIYSK